MDQNNQNQSNEPIAPASSPLINPQSVAVDQRPPSGSRAKKWLLPLIITLIVLIGGGSALAYFYFYNPPDKIVQKMMANALLNMKSFEYEAEIRTDIDPINLIDSEDSQLYITFSGAYDELDPKLPLSRFALALREGDSPQAHNILSLETRMNFEALYISLVELSDPGFFDVSDLLGKWIRIDMKEGDWQRTMSGMAGIYPIVYGDEDNPQKIAEIIKAKVEQFKKEATKIDILSIDKKLASEKINGVNTHHYAFSVNPDGLKKLAMAQKRLYGEVIEEIGGERWEPGSSEDSQWTAENEKLFNKFVSENKMPSGEIWIGKKDLMPYKITMNFEVKGNNPGTVNLSFWLKNFNQPIKVDLPAEYMSLEEIFGGLTDAFTMPDSEDYSFDGDWPEDADYSDWESGNIDFGDWEDDLGDWEEEADYSDDLSFLMAQDSDDDGLSDYMEIYIYGTDPNNSDTDGDGYLDGVEIASGYNPLGPGTIENMITMPNPPLPTEFWQQVPEGFFFLPREEIEQALDNYQKTGQLFPDSM